MSMQGVALGRLVLFFERPPGLRKGRGWRVECCNIGICVEEMSRICLVGGMVGCFFGFVWRGGVCALEEVRSW
jgi:hypothetical protein